jgi:type VI secretion system protein ImpF
MRIADLQGRLQPALLDRLTDDEPRRRSESRDQRVVSLTKLQEAVLRDLSWLLNADNLCSDEELESYPFVGRSVVNYGLPPLAGRSASTLDMTELEDILRTSILNFEPRLIRDTVKVRAIPPESGAGHNMLAFEIDAVLWAQPLPLDLFLRTEVDLESGSVSVSESRNPRST